MTLSLGMQADYASLIEKHQLESLGMIREADKFAKRLLVVNPEAADAYLTLGTANYIIGSLPAFKRFLLRFKRISGDKDIGILQLEIAAARGRYLRPFAKLILAMAALREKNVALARKQLGELVAEFPENPLFVKELAELDASGGVQPLQERIGLILAWRVKREMPAGTDDPKGECYAPRYEIGCTDDGPSGVSRRAGPFGPGRPAQLHGRFGVVSTGRSK